MSKLVVSTLESPAANGIITVSTGDMVYSPGSIVQVVNNYITTQSSVSVSSSYSVYTDIPNMSASITPKSANSKIYIMARWFGEASAGGIWNMMFNIKRNETVVGQPSGPYARGIHMAAQSYNFDNYSSTPETTFFDYMDSPATTDTVTYQVCVHSGSSFTLWTNRTVSVDDTGTCSVTLMEIAQ